MTASEYPSLRPGVRLRHDGARNQWVLLAPERVIELDPIAATIVQRLDGASSVTDIAQALALEFDADTARIEADVRELIEDLHRRRLLRR